MAKKLGKILLLTAAAGSAAAAAYYFMQKKTASQTTSEDEDYDNFTVEDEEPKNSHTYVPLTPDTKNSEAKETDSGTESETAAHDTENETVAACAQEPQEQDSSEQDSSGQDSAFTPLFQQISQTADGEEETVEEFFNEDTEDTEAPEKAE